MTDLRLDLCYTKPTCDIYLTILHRWLGLVADLNAARDSKLFIFGTSSQIIGAKNAGSESVS